MAQKLKVGKDSSKRRPAFLRAKRKIGEQIERVWKDFFEQNPGIKEEDVRRRLEERLKRRRETQSA